jgi:hypothetical protein
MDSTFCHLLAQIAIAVFGTRVPHNRALLCYFEHIDRWIVKGDPLANYVLAERLR